MKIVVLLLLAIVGVSLAFEDDTNEFVFTDEEITSKKGHKLDAVNVMHDALKLYVRILEDAEDLIVEKESQILLMMDELELILEQFPSLDTKINLRKDICIDAIHDFKIEHPNPKVYVKVLISLKELRSSLSSLLENASDKQLLEIDLIFESLRDHTKQFLQSDKFKSIFISLGAGTALLAATPTILSAIGFTAAGVQAGSLAASWMSMSK